MPAVDRWVRTRSTQMLYIYGANDPWGAEAFECGKKAAERECAVYYVEGGTHGSRIDDLEDPEKKAATDMILDFAGLAPSDPAVRQIDKFGQPKKNAMLDVKPDYLKHRGL